MVGLRAADVLGVPRATAGAALFATLASRPRPDAAQFPLPTAEDERTARAFYAYVAEHTRATGGPHPRAAAGARLLPGRPAGRDGGQLLLPPRPRQGPGHRARARSACSRGATRWSSSTWPLPDTGRLPGGRGAAPTSRPGAASSATTSAASRPRCFPRRDLFQPCPASRPETRCGAAALRPPKRDRTDHPRSLTRDLHSKRRHHRPRRPRQDHARRRHAAPERRLPRQPGGARARDGLERPRARARDHDPGQEHGRALRRHQDQHRRHPGPRRLRRRGRARAQDGRRRDAARRRVRGAAAADALRAQEGARGAAAPGGGDQQDRPLGRAAQGGAERGVRPLHRPRRHRGPARLPGALHERQAGLRPHRAGRPRRGPAPAVRRARPVGARAAGLRRRTCSSC